VTALVKKWCPAQPVARPNRKAENPKILAQTDKTGPIDLS
jgi:hypothetical protein